MGSSQFTLPVTHSRSIIRGAHKLSSRERVLVGLVVLLGSVWTLTILHGGNSHGSTTQTDEIAAHQQIAADMHVDPRRLSDVTTVPVQSTEQARFKEPEYAAGEGEPVLVGISTETRLQIGQPPNPQSVSDGSHSNPQQRLAVEEQHGAHSMLVQSLSTAEDEVAQGGRAPMITPPVLEPPVHTEEVGGPIRTPNTVAELIVEVEKFGAPSLRPNQDRSGMLLYPVVVEYNLSTPDFTRRYGQQYAAQPVKIKDSQTDWWKPEDWTMAAVRREVGSHTVYRDTKRCQAGKQNRDKHNCHRIKEEDPSMLGETWAAMLSVDVERMGIETYNDLFDQQIELAKQQRYLYAQEVGPRWLLEFAERLHQPKYFLNNIEDIVSDNAPDPRKELSDSIFPAFFFGPAGSQSPLHTDASMTRFWILELTGTKLIRLIPPSNNWRADATDQHDFQPELFTADILVPDFEKHPNLRGMLVYETLLEPGDILYIPEGWAHQALNLNWTCMASYNYNDDRNLQNRLSYHHYDKKKDEFKTEMKGHHFYLPLTNMSRDLGNVAIMDYFRMNMLEYAEVSDAARAHIAKLKRLEIDPEDMSDFYSIPVLDVAITRNYLALAKWLVEEEGIPLRNDTIGRGWLKGVESELELIAMAAWMRQHMGIDASDMLAEFPTAPSGGSDDDDDEDDD